MRPGVRRATDRVVVGSAKALPSRKRQPCDMGNRSELPPNSCGWPAMVTSRWRRSPLLTSTPERSADHVPSFGMQRLTAVTATGTEGPGNADLFAVLKLASGGRATTTHQPHRPVLFTGGRSRSRTHSACSPDCLCRHSPRVRTQTEGLGGGADDGRMITQQIFQETFLHLAHQVATATGAAIRSGAHSLAGFGRIGPPPGYEDDGMGGWVPIVTIGGVITVPTVIVAFLLKSKVGPDVLKKAAEVVVEKLEGGK